jgi:hypothetical protein
MRSLKKSLNPSKPHVDWTEDLSTPGPARYTIMYALPFFNVHISIPLFKYFPVEDGDVNTI